MHATTVAVDLAKDVIEVAVTAEGRAVSRRERLSRTGFSRFLAGQPLSQVVMEACSGAHFWARRAQAEGHTVTLLPAQYVRPYRRRNKTDRADCSALLEAVKNPELKPVAIKSPWHQRFRVCIGCARSGWRRAPDASTPCVACCGNSG
jgi:transposase